MNNHQTLGRCFVGHSVYVRCKIITWVRSSNSAHISQSSLWLVGKGRGKSTRKCESVHCIIFWREFCFLLLYIYPAWSLFLREKFRENANITRPKSSYVCVLRLMMYHTFSLHDLQFLWMFHYSYIQTRLLAVGSFAITDLFSGGS